MVPRRGNPHRRAGEEAGVRPRAVSAILLGHHSLLAFREGSASMVLEGARPPRYAALLSIPRGRGSGSRKRSAIGSSGSTDKSPAGVTALAVGRSSRHNVPGPLRGLRLSMLEGALGGHSLDTSNGGRGHCRVVCGLQRAPLRPVLPRHPSEGRGRIGGVSTNSSGGSSSSGRPKPTTFSSTTTRIAPTTTCSAPIVVSTTTTARASFRARSSPSPTTPSIASWSRWTGCASWTSGAVRGRRPTPSQESAGSRSCA